MKQEDKIYIFEWTERSWRTIKEMVEEYAELMAQPEKPKLRNGLMWLGSNPVALRNLIRNIDAAKKVKTFFSGERYRFELSYEERAELLNTWANLTNWYNEKEDNRKKFYLTRDTNDWTKCKSVRKKTCREKTEVYAEYNQPASQVKEGVIEYVKKPKVR